MYFTRKRIWKEIFATVETSWSIIAKGNTEANWGGRALFCATWRFFYREWNWMSFESNIRASEIHDSRYMLDRVKNRKNRKRFMRFYIYSITFNWWCNIIIQVIRYKSVLFVFYNIISEFFSFYDSIKRLSRYIRIDLLPFSLAP